MQAQLLHNNVVELIGLAVDGDVIMIVEQYFEHGSLLSHLQKFGRLVLPDMMLRFAMDVANGMAYLSNLGLVHRDLAVRRILY
jgi:serine/threonine protein kinase